MWNGFQCTEMIVREIYLRNLFLVPHQFYTMCTLHTLTFGHECAFYANSPLHSNNIKCFTTVVFLVITRHFILYFWQISYVFFFNYLWYNKLFLKWIIQDVSFSIELCHYLDWWHREGVVQLWRAWLAEGEENHCDFWSYKYG